jgi:hypothetical protein
MLRMFLSADPAKDGVVLAEQTEGQSLARGCGVGQRASGALTPARELSAGRLLPTSPLYTNIPITPTPFAALALSSHRS